jgi:hypothetical protein
MNKTVTSPAVLYGCEIRPLVLREKLRLRVSDNTVLRGILEPKRDAVVGGYRKFHNEEHYNFVLFIKCYHIRKKKSQRMRLAGHAVCTDMRDAYKILVENPAEKRQLKRLTNR